MAVTTRFPTTNAAYSGAGFTDPGNLHADDGVYGTAVPAKNNGLGTTYGTFGFDAAIPSGSTIDAVKILFEFKVSTTASVAIQRVKARIGAVDEENHDNTTEPLTDTPVTVDITADRAWTRADLLDGTFEAVAEARRGNTNTSYTASWDYIKVEVTYTVPPQNFTLTAEGGSYSETGAAAGVRADRALGASTGSYTQAGSVVGLQAGRQLAAVGTSYTWTGSAATLTYTPASGFTLTAAGGSVFWTGSAATTRATRQIVATATAYTLSGTAAGLRRTATVMVASASAYSVSGSAATLTGPGEESGSSAYHAITGRSGGGLLHDEMVTMLEPLLTNTAHAPAANTAAVVTLTAITDKRQKIRYVAWSYSATPTAGGLTISGLHGDTLALDVSAAGPGALVFPPLVGQSNTAVVVTLAAGGGTVVGKLNVSSFEGYGY